MHCAWGSVHRRVPRDRATEQQRDRGTGISQRTPFVGRRSARLRARAELARTGELALVARAYSRRIARVREKRDASGRRAVALCNRARATTRRRRRHLDAQRHALEIGRMNIAEPLVLRKDVVLVPVTDLAPEVRSKFEYDEGDYTLSRMHGRVTSQILDGETASLLEIFRQPTTIVDAVIRNSRELSKDPAQWLDELLPHIDGFLRNQVLVPADSKDDDDLRPLIENGGTAAGWQIVNCVHLMEESEIYRVRRDGVEGAMKIARVPLSFANEEEVLRWLDGNVAPKMLDSGTHDDRVYFVIEWCEGTDSRNAATVGRDGPTSMLTLCTSIANAYAELHERSVVHGDVHPRNVMVAQNRSVRLIDFGLSQIEGHSTHRVRRGGMYGFYEPEYLAGVRQGFHRAASFKGEQYAVAALMYLLITGEAYGDFRLDREEMMRQAED